MFVVFFSILAGATLAVLVMLVGGKDFKYFNVLLLAYFVLNLITNNVVKKIFRDSFQGSSYVNSSIVCNTPPYSPIGYSVQLVETDSKCHHLTRTDKNKSSLFEPSIRRSFR